MPGDCWGGGGTWEHALPEPPDRLGDPHLREVRAVVAVEVDAAGDPGDVPSEVYCQNVQLLPPQFAAGKVGDAAVVQWATHRMV